MLSCGEPLPLSCTVLPASVTCASGCASRLALLAAYSESCALRALAAAAVPAKACVCDGPCDEVSATDSIPLATPTDSDWLKPRGLRPRRSGRPNVPQPLPASCVPTSATRDTGRPAGGETTTQ